MPFSSYPIQLSVDIVEDGEVVHAYDTLVSGATQFAPWVREHVPIGVEELEGGRPFAQVMADLAGLLQAGDVLVAHNMAVGAGMAIVRTARCLGYNEPELDGILATPRFCTMRCAYARAIWRGRCGMHELCEHFGVVLQGAHDARVDSNALAQCVAMAWHRGVMLE